MYLILLRHSRAFVPLTLLKSIEILKSLEMLDFHVTRLVTFPIFHVSGTFSDIAQLLLTYKSQLIPFFYA
jgi:hypothetical protein